VTLTINLAGFALMLFVVWWFWLYRGTTKKASIIGIIDIEVNDGGYVPAHLVAQKNREITLRFTRKTANPCAAVVLIEDFGIREELPLNQAHEIRFTADKLGEFDISCQMAMFRGSLTIKD